jgi:hypothetical protein
MIASVMAAAADRSPPCRNSPKVIGECFNVHGRLAVWNGMPSVRIWHVGTRRIFGVFDGAGDADSNNLFPESVAALLGADPLSISVYGDYEVCPLDRDRPGRMRPVCIAGTAHLVATNLDGMIVGTRP